MTRPTYLAPRSLSLLCLIAMGIVCLIAAFFQKNPILQLGGWPVFPGTPHYQFLTDLQKIQPGMTVQEVRQRLARYEERQHSPDQLAGWAESTEIKTAIKKYSSQQGFTGQLSYNHSDADRVTGCYIVSVVKNRVVAVHIYDE
jgi:hypothetical protein